MSQSKQTVCLNMIVRNESRIIERCLDSVRSLIDYWVIVDTGSTDGTQSLIRECLRDLPGELIERRWVDFAHNRSEALEFARGKSDYVLVIDADEVLVKDEDYAPPPLTHDAYYLKVHFEQIAFWRVHLFRNEPGWHYESPVHEYLIGPKTATYDRLNEVVIDSLRDGWRGAQPDVCQRDVEILLREHEREPHNARTNYYLAQSYVSVKEPELALKYFQQCVETTFWSEERWSALLQIADLKQQLQRDWPEVLAAYLDAYQSRPQRAEPLYRIAVHYRWQGAFHLAQLFLQQAVAIPYPDADYLSVEDRLYRYLIKMALATCCYHTGQYEAGVRYCDELLNNRESMPSNIYEQVIRNRQQCTARLAESNSTSEQLPTVKVFVAFRTAAPHLDNCIDRLLSQTGVSLEIVFLDLGSTPRSHHQIPTEDPRVTLLHAAGEDIWSLVAGRCEADDVVLFLNGSDWLISEEALAQLREKFNDSACLVTYGQYQYADGAFGLAGWIPDIKSARVLIDDWRCTYPLAVRGSLLKQVVSEEPTATTSRFPELEGEGFPPEEHVALARKLFAAAGSAGVNFNDYPICVYDPETTSPNGSDEVLSDARSGTPSVSKNTLPLISCLCVTSNRLVSLKEAIHCYCKQSYPNKELIVVTDGAPRYRQAISDYIGWLGRKDIRLVCVDEAEQSFEALRNVSLDAATGAVMCRWDDNDLNHPQRLERQFEHLSSARVDGCCFTDQLRFFFPARLLYWSEGQNLIPETLMAYRDKRYLFEQLAESENVTPFQDAGFLNICSHYDNNVISEAHRLIAIHGSRSVEFIREHESILQAALVHYRLPEPYSVATAEGPVLFIPKPV